MRSFSFSPSSLRISRAIVVCPLLVSVDCDIAPYYPNFSLPAIKIKAEGRRCSQSRPSVHLSAESESVNSGKHPWEQEQTDGITHITTEAITIDTATKGITTGITMADTTIGTGVGCRCQWAGRVLPLLVSELRFALRLPFFEIARVLLRATSRTNLKT